MTRIMLVDDDSLVIAGLSAMLLEDDTIQIVGTAQNGQEAIEMVQEVPCDVILMDLRMPNVSGIEATRAIKSLPDPPKILALTTWNTDDMIRDALAAGADGFLLKDASPTELADAIMRVASGAKVLAPAVTDRLITAFTQSGRSHQHARDMLSNLTPLEFEVATCIGEGMKNSDIATERYMSIGNVKACVSRILQKLELDNRVQVATLIHEAQRRD
ncbi:MAG: response regulator transcription factor [Micrococcaceae bacterium]|nr:response regulator transcription factor [Micrococcaceae bacterium]